MPLFKSRGGLTRGRDINEKVRAMLSCISHRWDGIHKAITNLTGTKHWTSEQHVEWGASRRLWDAADLKKLVFGSKIGIHSNVL